MTGNGVNAASGESGAVPVTYVQLLRFLFAGSGIWAMLGCVGAAVFYKTMFGEWSWIDFAIIAAFYALRGFIEWGIHVYLYHGHPLPFVGRGIKGEVVTAHLAHHQDPFELSTLLITWRGVLVLLIGTFFLASAVFASLDMGASFMLGFALAGMIIEVVHLICHSRIPHRSALMRRIVALHRRHHHENGNAFYGVSSSLGDLALGTYDKSPRS